jgi:hypothetical protein
MSDPAPNVPVPECRRFLMRLPLPLWIGLGTAVLVVVTIGMPIYRQYAAIREIEKLGGQVEMRPRGPNWLRNSMGKEWMKSLDHVVTVDLENREATDVNFFPTCVV